MDEISNKEKKLNICFEPFLKFYIKLNVLVMSVDVASKALSMIEKQKKDIGLVIANIEMPHIDSHSFITALLHKNIPLICTFMFTHLYFV